MRIGAGINVGTTVEGITEQIAKLAEAGFHAAWASQIFGHDALTALAVAGAAVPGIELGTAVVPVYPRHPQVMAAQALTVQSATNNRLLLGIGLSHQVVVENCWGMSFDRPARYMKEYLAALMPMLHGETANVDGEVLKAVTWAPLDIPEVKAPPVLVAALAPAMLKLAGTVADGTATWMTGTGTIRSHIAPTIQAAADAAGRPTPRIAVALPVCVTSDPAAAAAAINEDYSIYPNLPSYRAMLDLEGADTAAAIAFIGSAAQIREQLTAREAAGATDLRGAIPRT
ncbi:MAG: TIGR03564 family F420-dependent LLM class oxidoreductase, partial [Actinomycetota bacterium]